MEIQDLFLLYSPSHLTMAHKYRAHFVVFCEYRFLSLPSVLDYHSLSGFKCLMGPCSPMLRPVSLLLLQHCDHPLYDV